MIHIIMHVIEIILLSFIMGALFGIKKRFERLEIRPGIRRVKSWPYPDKKK